jgi:hypothetical protein
LDQFYGKDGITPVGAPAETSFQLPGRALRAPGFSNWSFGIEQRLPAAFFLRAEFMQKRGRNGFAFAHPSDSGASSLGGPYVLQNMAREHYDAVEMTVRRVFRGSYMFLISYTRSAARSNAVIDFQVSDPVFSRQSGGPLPWDSPNRFLSWGWIPMGKLVDIAYSLEWRSGFPFSLVDQGRSLVGTPNSRRFPAFFALNLHVERRFQWLKYQWAFRWGCNNVTGRDNPSTVNNNIDSAQFLTFASLQHRAFTARIRFLGRK